MLEIYDVLKHRDEEKKKRFLEAINRLKDKKILVILFGSRAKGKSNYLSDFDVLIIGEVDIDLDFVDVFKFKGVEEIKKGIDELNSVILDALIEGMVLIDNLNVFRELRDYALRRIKERGIKKVKIGWVPLEFDK